MLCYAMLCVGLERSGGAAGEEGDPGHERAADADDVHVHQRSGSSPGASVGCPATLVESRAGFGNIAERTR